MDDRISRAVTELKRAGISPLEFAVKQSNGSVKEMAEAIRLVIDKFIDVSSLESDVEKNWVKWIVLQEYFHALADELGKNQPPGHVRLVNWDSNFLAEQQTIGTSWRVRIRNRLEEINE